VRGADVGVNVLWLMLGVVAGSELESAKMFNYVEAVRAMELKLPLRRATHSSFMSRVAEAELSHRVEGCRRRRDAKPLADFKGRAANGAPAGLPVWMQQRNLLRPTNAELARVHPCPHCGFL